MTEPTDPLLERAAGGDAAAWEQLMAAHRPRLKRVVADQALDNAVLREAARPNF